MLVKLRDHMWVRANTIAVLAVDEDPTNPGQWGCYVSFTDGLQMKIKFATEIDAVQYAVRLSQEVNFASANMVPGV